MKTLDSIKKMVREWLADDECCLDRLFQIYAEDMTALERAGAGGVDAEALELYAMLCAKMTAIEGEGDGPALPLIQGPECPSCGRDNSDHQYVCTGDDCPGVLIYAAAPAMLAAAKEAVEYWEAGESDRNIEANIAALRAAITRAEGR